MTEATTIPFRLDKLITDCRSIARSHCCEEKLSSLVHGCGRVAHSRRAHVHVFRGGLAGRKQLGHPLRPRHKIICRTFRLSLTTAPVHKLTYLVDVGKHVLHRLALCGRLAGL